jgi:hypothetical protein
MSASRATAWPRAYGRRCRGQALLIAVLVLFAVASLAALFAAIIGSQVVQVTRHSDVVELRSIAEAGLNFANEQLTYGMDGADWRPPLPPNDQYRCGRGFFTLSVDYGPDPTRLQSRWIRVVASAFFPDNPLVRYTFLDLKPVLLTDYARFITDRYHTARPAALGSAGVELAGQPRAGYVFTVTGPVRSNTDLVWYGLSRLDLYNSEALAPGMAYTWRDLGVLRDDRVEVAGQIRPADAVAGQDALQLWINGAQRAADLLYPAQPAEQQDYANGFPDWTDRTTGVTKPNTWRMLADMPRVQFSLTEYIDRTYFAVPRVRPPEIDALDPDLQTNRYWALTRDAGQWVQPAPRAAFVNPGAWGWGWADMGGIYIDNFGDIQYQHDLEKLRLNWVGSVGAHRNAGEPEKGDLRVDGTGSPPNGPADWWDKTGHYYAPPGARIVVHGEAACPYLEITRDDVKHTADDVLYCWRDPTGAPTTSFQVPTGGACSPTVKRTPQLGINGATAIFPFPANGVVYAEGNIIISGTMPPRKADITGGNVWAYFDYAKYDDAQGRDRRFDLTVVSGGTIYIEGDLLTPRSAGLIPDDWARDRDDGSRIALFARDYVCVNTTAFNPRPRDLFQTVSAGDPPQNAFYNDAQPLYPEGDSAYPRFAFLRGPIDEDINSDAGAEAWDGETPFPTMPNPGDTAQIGTMRFLYNNIRLRIPALRDQVADLRLILGHSGWYQLHAEDPENVEPPAAGAQVEVQLGINPLGTAEPFPGRPWDQGAGDDEWYAFLSPLADPPPDPALNQSPHWYAGDPTNDYLEFLPNEYQAMQASFPLGTPRAAAQVSGNDILHFISRVTPVKEQDEQGAWHWVVKPGELGYLLGNLAITPPRHSYTYDEAGNLVLAKDDKGNPIPAPPLPVQIQAAVYAQNGSWFIIPGPWFNEDPSKGGEDADYQQEYPGYHEPLNMQISFFGAISENMPASLGDVADWTSKWAGMQGADLASSLRYDFDPLLRSSFVKDAAGRTYPRFRRLPLSPDVLIWGERISGQAGV